MHLIKHISWPLLNSIMFRHLGAILGKFFYNKEIEVQLANLSITSS